MIRLLLLFLLFLSCINFSPSLSWAQVTVEFTPSVSANLGAPDGREEIERMVNEGLKSMGRTNPAALALYNSRQKIKLVCYGSYEADQLGVKKPEAELITQSWGETLGDFNKDGTPKKGGTTYIVLDCDKLKQYRWYDSWKFLGVTQSMWDILVHELLHATHRDRRHPPDDLDMYSKWVAAFNQSITKLLRTTIREAKERGYFRMPDWWVEELKKALKAELLKAQAAQAKKSQSGEGSTPSTPQQGQGSQEGNGSQKGLGPQKDTGSKKDTGSQEGKGSQRSDSSSSSSGDDQRTSQSTTFQGPYQTQSGTALAATKGNLPTVVTGTWYDAFFSPESFIASITGDSQSVWNPGDQKASYVGTGSGLSRLQDLQLTIDVRFITIKDSFFERIGVDFDFVTDDTGLNQATPKEQTDTVPVNFDNSQTKDFGFIRIGDNFFERIGIDFDAPAGDQKGQASIPWAVQADIEWKFLEQFYSNLGSFSYKGGVSFGYDTGFFDIPYVSFIGRQQVDVGPLVVNDNPSKIFGLNSDVSPWRIVEDTHGAGLPLGGWTHASMPWGTTLGWQPTGEAGTLDAFTQEFGNVIRYEEPNAGISGAPAPLNPDDWPQVPALPVAHMKIKKVW